MKKAVKKRSKRKTKPTWSDLHQEVKAAGGEFVRQGSTAHEIWSLPNGQIIVLLSKHRTQQVGRHTLELIRRRLRAKKAS